LSARLLGLDVHPYSLNIDDYEVCRRLKKEYITRNIPVIFIIGQIGVEDERKGFRRGAVDDLTKPISPPAVRARVKTNLAFYDKNQELNER